MNLCAIIAAAMVIDAIVGEPDWMWSRLPHPVVLMGRAINKLEAYLNRKKDRKFKGIALVILITLVAGIVGQLIANLPGGTVFEILLAAIILAQRSLVDHVAGVADGLRISIDAGRQAVGNIVGRDTSDMDPSDVSRAAIESAAENFSDGVVAPAFWFLLLGLPGLLIYKTVNTADSMIGYRNQRYAEFGWAAARFDDVLNWVPARLTALLIALAHGRVGIWSTIRRDAPLHRSPNAGWPEAAMAVCLNVPLSGPRSYGGIRKDFPWVFPEGKTTIDASDIDRAVVALWKTWALGLFLVLVLALV